MISTALESLSDRPSKPLPGRRPDEGLDHHDSYETLRRIVAQLDQLMGNAVREIHGLNERARMVSFNAKIEAGRAGGAVGAAFGVVAGAMQQLSERTSGVADGLRAETRDQIRTLQATVEQIATEVQGERLADMALTNIDLIDRNLYERTCDVRWWATDPAIIDAVQNSDPDRRAYASQRMGVILDAYTVYFDLVLADRHGKIIANGRPEKYRSEGQSHGSAAWFQSAMNGKSDQEFGFQGVHDSTLVDGESVLIYSCGIRPAGNHTGTPIGALGVVFNWRGLSQTIVEQTKIPDSLKDRSHVAIVDDEGVVLANTRTNSWGETLRLPRQSTLFRQSRGFVVDEVAGQRSLIAHARAPGFETYSTGWHSVIVQPV
jgi:hypothetical protein